MHGSSSCKVGDLVGVNLNPRTNAEGPSSRTRLNSDIPISEKAHAGVVTAKLLTQNLDLHRCKPSTFHAQSTTLSLNRALNLQMWGSGYGPLLTGTLKLQTTPDFAVQNY